MINSSPIPTIRDQVRRNAVALISLVVAVASLGYNTWRNETTEYQRNLRHASFRVVENLAELQSIANTLAYAPERDPNAWVDGWGLVIAIRSVGRVLPPPVPAETEALEAVWKRNFEALLDDGTPERKREADKAIAGQIMDTSEAVLGVLRSLD